MQDTEEDKEEQSHVLGFLNGTIGKVAIGGLIFVLAFLWLGNTSLSEEATPTQAETLSPLTPEKEPLVLRKLEKSPLTSKAKSGFKEDINDYKTKTLEALTRNTMGRHELPEFTRERLTEAIDSLFDALLEDTYNSYSKFKVNIPRVDTLPSNELYKMLE